MNKVIICCVAAALSLAVGCAKTGHPKEKHEAISESAMPQAVRDGFAKAYPNAQIEKVKKETYPDGTVHYEVEYRGADGKEQEVELNADGDVLDKH